MIILSLIIESICDVFSSIVDALIFIPFAILGITDNIVEKNKSEKQKQNHSSTIDSSDTCNFCPECGKPVSSHSDKFCKHCGHKLK